MFNCAWLFVYNTGIFLCGLRNACMSFCVFSFRKCCFIASCAVCSFLIVLNIDYYTLITPSVHAGSVVLY
jgi:hypothetical protein